MMDKNRFLPPKKGAFCVFVALLISLLLAGCAPIPQESGTPAEDLNIHFIDVGQADCILLEQGGAYLLVDGGNKADGQLVVSYLEQQGVQELTAVVCTHAHEDHVGGLPSVLAVYPTAAVYAPTNTYASNIFDKFVYYTDQQGLEITIPQPGDTIGFGDTEVTVMGPTKSYPDANNTSIVLLVRYGQTAFLLTGDMETEAENDMLDFWGEKTDWQVDLLKVGHHGSNSSSGYRLLYETEPDYGVISVGEGNTYGHPHKEPMERFRASEVTVLRTDKLGTILAHSDGKEITLTWDNQSGSPENAEPAETIVYIGNVNSKKFHTPDCANLPALKNQVEFSSIGEAIAAGYTACTNCLG